MCFSKEKKVWTSPTCHMRALMLNMYGIIFSNIPNVRKPISFNFRCDINRVCVHYEKSLFPHKATRLDGSSETSLSWTTNTPIWRMVRLWLPETYRVLRLRWCRYNNREYLYMFASWWQRYKYVIIAVETYWRCCILFYDVWVPNWPVDGRAGLIHILHAKWREGSSLTRICCAFGSRKRVSIRSCCLFSDVNTRSSREKKKNKRPLKIINVSVR